MNYKGIGEVVAGVIGLAGILGIRHWVNTPSPPVQVISHVTIRDRDTRTDDCVATVNNRLQNNPSGADYIKAGNLAFAAWNEKREGHAADCVGTLLANGYGYNQDYSGAIDWWRLAQSAGIDESERINIISQKLVEQNARAQQYSSQIPDTSNKGLTGNQAIALGVGAAIGATACAFITGCTSGAANMVGNAAKGVIERKAGDAAYNTIFGR